MPVPDSNGFLLQAVNSIMKMNMKFNKTEILDYIGEHFVEPVLNLYVTNKEQRKSGWYNWNKVRKTILKEE